MSVYNQRLDDICKGYRLFHKIFGAVISRRPFPWACAHLQLPVQSVPITTKVVCLDPARGEVYSIQHYVIVSDLRQVGGFLCVLDMTEILLNVALCTITPYPIIFNSLNAVSMW